jgi:hypothetical protein
MHYYAGMSAPGIVVVASHMTIFTLLCQTVTQTTALALDCLEFDGDGEGEGEPEEEIPDALVADDVTEDGDVCLFHLYKLNDHGSRENRVTHSHSVDWNCVAVLCSSTSRQVFPGLSPTTSTTSSTSTKTLWSPS